MIAGKTNEELTTLTLAPNPVNEQVLIQYKVTECPAVLYLTDLSGMVLERIALSATKGAVQFNMKRYRPGMYYLSLENAVAGVTKKMVVIR